MQFKMWLSVTLLVVIVMGLINFGYTHYVVHNAVSFSTGKEVLAKHGLLIYSQLTLHLLQFAMAGLMVYKR